MSSPSSRLHGLDVLRLVSFYCIGVYHSYSALIFVEYRPSEWAGTAMPLVHFLPRALPFSGFTVVALFAFLAGLRREPLRARPLFLLMAAGLALLFVMYSDFGAGELFFEWDIYHYLLVALLSLVWISRGGPARAWAFGLPGLLLTALPLWEWVPASLFPRPLAHALVGICDADGRGGWFLLPWIGLPWAFFLFGRLLRAHPAVGRREALLWAPFLAAGVATWGRYFGVAIGPGFYCFMFRQPTWVFWGHFVWVAFAMRLSVVESVQAWLHRRALCRAVSALELNRRFGSAYLVQLGFLWLGSEVLASLVGARALFFAYSVLLLPATELGLRAERGLRARLQKRPRYS